MSTEHESADDALKGWLEDNAKSFVSEEGAFCTSFLLVAEYMDSSGQFYSFTLKDPTSPAWRLRGLLEYARENDFNLKDDTELDDEDGDY
jgi:hypothetical protein